MRINFAKVFKLTVKFGVLWARLRKPKFAQSENRIRHIRQKSDRNQIGQRENVAQHILRFLNQKL